MSKKRHKAEEIVSKLRQVEVLTTQGKVRLSFSTRHQPPSSILRNFLSRFICHSRLMAALRVLNGSA